MQIEMKRPMTLIVLIVAVAVASFYVFRESEDSTVQIAPEPELLIEESPEIPDEATGAEAEEVELVESSDRTSYWVKGGQNRQNKQSDIPDFELATSIQWEEQHIAEATVESAMSGNIDDAMAVGSLIGQCRKGFDNEAQVQSSLRMMSRHFKQGKTVQGGFVLSTGESVSFSNSDDYETFMWTRFLQCDTTRPIFNQALRDRLNRLAENGSVTARYLYAMWLPDRGKTEEDQLIDWLVYQNRALEYTWQNINEGQALGMLAYGKSLSSIQPAFFTARNRNYGQAFILAAEKCAPANLMLSSQANNITKAWKERQMVQFVNQLDRLSDEIAETFCR